MGTGLPSRHVVCVQKDLMIGLRLCCVLNLLMIFEQALDFYFAPGPTIMNGDVSQWQDPAPSPVIGGL